MLRDTFAARAIEEIIQETPSSTPEFRIPEWWDKTEHYDSHGYGPLKKMVKDFVLGRFTKMSHNCSNGKHFYFTKENGSQLWIFKDNPSTKVRICVAQKLGGAFIGNASALMAQRSQPRKGQKRGKINWTGGEQRIQAVLKDVMPMVPFRMFAENKLDLASFQLIEKGPEEFLELNKEGWRNRGNEHYTGAMVFSLKIRKGNDREFFLFDIDRNDLKLKNFNAFLSKLPSSARSIKEAYDLLKPQEVKDAERFLKTEVPRQGEWFFIPVIGEFKARTVKQFENTATRSFTPRKVEAVLQAKGNNPHRVSEICEEGYVRGEVSHGGGDHVRIKLGTWHKPVANGATVSFKITGGID